MRTLTPTLEAAQRTSSAAPHVRVRLADRDVGALRLRWTRVYEGVEPDGPCGVAIPADGSLLRARVDPGTAALSHQRVASPGPGSDLTGWTGLGTVSGAPRLGLAAAGTRAFLATVRTNGVDIEVRESTDSGASFGSSSVVATTGATVEAVTCALQADGSAAVLYAVAGVVYAVTRTGAGSWSAPASWSQSLASISGLAAWFESDYNVAVSGATSAGDEGAWSTIFGVGNNVAPGAWLSLTELALAAPDTDVTYLATGIARPEAPLAAVVESFAGGGAYDRVQLVGGVGGTFLLSQLWRDPRPFGHASAHGLGLASGGGSAWLCAPDAVWQAATTPVVDELTDDVLELDLRLAADDGRLRLVLRNDDGRYGAASAPVALAPGGELRIEPGYQTASGFEVSAGPRLWITSVRRLHGDGRATVEVEAVDAWGLLRAWTAPRQLVWDAGSANAFQVLTQLARRAGLELTSSGASTELTTLQPAFTVRAGERGSTAAGRLLDALPDLVRMTGTGTGAVLFEPAVDDPVDYTYDATHPPRRLRLDDGRASAGWARIFGDGVFAEAIDDAALRDGAPTLIVVDQNLGAQARVDARATTALRKSQLAIPRGEAVVAPNVGQEIGDVIAITDASAGLEAEPFRVAALRLRYNRGGSRPLYEMTLTLGAV